MQTAARAWLINVKDEDAQAYTTALAEWRQLAC